MTKNEKDTALNLSKEVLDLTIKLKGALTVSDDGTIASDKKLYETMLPEDMTLEQFKRFQNFETDFFNATVQATAEMGESFLEKHKKIESVRLDKMILGKDKIRAHYHRSFEGTTGGVGNATPITRHGEVTAKYSSGVGSTSSASFGRMRDHFRAQGQKLFGS